MKKRVVFLLALVCLTLLAVNFAFAEEWVCDSCGTKNTGNFCTNCGAGKLSASWVCPSCGQENTGNFCSNCGSKKESSSETSTSKSASTIKNIKCSYDDGITTITWEDSANKGPYQVIYTTANWVDYGTDYGFEPTTKKQLSLPYLIPGETYSITVQSDSSSGSTEFKVPKSAFTEFKASKPLTINPASFDLTGDGYYTTFRLDLNYPQLSRARTYAWVLALKTPLGYSSVVYGDEQFEMERQWSGYYWNLSISDFMDSVKANFGEIPKGEYAFECYFNGLLYGTATFKVYIK